MSTLGWDAIVDRLTPRRPVQAGSPQRAEGTGVEHLVAWVAALPEGRRNDGLFWASCRAVERGCHDVLERLADAAIKAGLTPREAERTIRSAARRGGAA